MPATTERSTATTQRPPRPRGKRSSPAARREERLSVESVQRARLLAAMLRIAAERGVARTSVADVVAAAGVSRRTFYEMFENVSECFDDAASLAFEQARGVAIEAWRSAEGSWHEGVRAALGSLLAIFDEQPEIACVLLIEWQHGGESAQRRRSEAMGRLAEALDRARYEDAGSESRPPSPLTSEAVVGAICSILAERLQRERSGQGRLEPLSPLLGPLMSFLVLPYLGRAAAERELRRATPQLARRSPSLARPGPSGDIGALPRERGRRLKIRLTYRTLKVLAVIADRDDASNRQIADAAGIVDQGQASKLLGRLKRSGLIENTNRQATFKGQPNRWRLTAEGKRVLRGLPLG